MKRITTIALGLVAVTGCFDDEKAPSSLLAPIPSGAVQAVVQRVAEYGRDSVVYRVHVAARDVQVGAYQGTLTFNAAALEILSIRPASVDGEFRVINSDSAAAGSIRFAAFSAESFKETQVFDFVGRPKMDMAAAELVARLTVVGEVEGTAVEARQVRANDGVRDARTNALIVRPTR